MQESIGSIVRKLEQNYLSGQTTISEFVRFSLKENVDKIEAYSNSKHTTGETDSQGREKPFFNIVTAATNIWYRATDIDRKNIRIKASKSGDFIGAFLATIHLQEWMRKFAFGQFLNEWGRVLAKYGSAVLKFVEKDGELIPSVVPWNRLIIDQVDFDNNVKIERLYFTPAQLRQNEMYDQTKVEQLIESKTTRKGLNNQDIDSLDDYIEVYEVHGELPRSLLTDKENDKEYVQQMHAFSYTSEKDGDKVTYKDFTLYRGKEKDPYMITHLIKEDGRSMAKGAVEHLFEPQWMMNHTAKLIKDQLDLASKIVYQTSDANFVGRNVLSEIENGDILIYSVTGSKLEQVNNNSHDISAIQSFATMWKSLSNEQVGISESMLGLNPPSGTAWRQTEALLQESHSLFELMTENKGLYIEEMMRKFILPNLKKQFDNSDEVASDLDEAGITQIDSIYIPNEAKRRVNKRYINQILDMPEGIMPMSQGQMMSPDTYQQDTAMEEANIRSQISQYGNRRFFKPSDIPTTTWKELFKDLEWEVEVEVTGEDTDKQATLTTLSTVLKTVVNDPQKFQIVFNKILEATGTVSPIEMSGLKAPAVVGAGTTTNQ